MRRVRILLLALITAALAPYQLLASLAEEPLRVARWHHSLEDALRDPDAVLKLNLSHRDLTTFPAEILRLPNLRVLVLNHNRLSELPAGLSRLSQLSELELNHNAFTRFPRELLALPRLNELELSGNRIAELPDDIDRLAQLTELEIIDNQLTSLPPALAHLRYLEEIKADNNRLASLPVELFALPSLQDLTVSGNLLTSLPDPLPSATLRELDLSRNRLARLPDSLRRLDPSICLVWQDTLQRLPPDLLAWLLAREQHDIDVFIQRLAEARKEADVLHYFTALEQATGKSTPFQQAQAALVGARAFRDLGQDARARQLAAQARALFADLEARPDSAPDDDHDGAAFSATTVTASLREAATLHALLETEAQQAALRARGRAFLIAGLLLVGGLLAVLWRVHLRLRGTHAALSHQSSLVEEQAARLERLNATKDILFSLIGHDLRGPLSAISSLSARLRTDPASPAGARLLGLLEGTALQLSVTLDNLLRWAQSQIREARFEPAFLDLGEIVGSVVAQYRVMLAAKDIALETDLARGLHVYGDATMLETVARNLLGNAVKFSETGDRIRIAAGSHDGAVYLEISDTGVGMTEEQVAGLFHPDSARSLEGTRGERGTGLGLLLCDDFVRRHQGRLAVHSRPGEGSVFRVTLPACALATAT